MMNAGKLQQKVLFFDFGLVSDGAGGFSTSENRILILSTWCSARQIKASRTAENLQETINAVYEIKLRQRAGFMPKSDYIVEVDSRLCTITSIVEDFAKGKYWIITLTHNALLNNG